MQHPGRQAAGIFGARSGRNHQGKTLFIVGNDQGKGFAVNGTRNGAYALLERHFGYRWLWPGADGEVFDRQPLLTLSPLNEQDEPALPIRGMRNYYPTTRAPHAREVAGHVADRGIQLRECDRKGHSGRGVPVPVV